MPETTQFSSMQNKGAGGGALQADTILLARYKIEGQLGGGGQGAVYQARDLNFPDARRLVAIKEMHVSDQEPSLRAEAIKTFQREANILATLNHPAIPKIYDFFEQNGRAYLVMEYINGRDMEALLVKTKTLPMKKIIEWSIDLCDVLQYLHTQQPEPIIFRDMKPANIMVDSLGKVRLIDFGIAKIFVRSNLPGTQIGTEGYSAPEQYKGKATPVSDIYSLGATLHHLITRKDPRLEPPFSFSERALKDFNPEVQPKFQEIIDRALEFDAEKRYPSCADMKADLETMLYQGQGMMNPSATPTTNGQQASSSAASPEGGTGFFSEGAATGNIQAKWTFKAEDEIRSSPSSYKNMVFVGSYDTNVWAVNAETGEQMWKRATEGGIASSPIIDPEYGQVLFGSEDFTYYAVDHRDGKLNWTYQTRGKIRGTGRVAHGYVFFGSDDGKLYALIASNGRFMWEYDAIGAVRSTPYVTNDRIIFGTEEGELLALELNGNKKWGFRSKRSITSSPIVDSDNICYVGSFDGHLYAIDASSGYSQWKFRTMSAIVASPAIFEEHVYVGSTDGKFYCVNSATGREKWNFETGKPIVSSPKVYQNVVYFGGTDKKLYALDAKSGKELWTYQAGGEITSTPYIANNMIFFGSLDRNLYALPLIST